MRSRLRDLPPTVRGLYIALAVFAVAIGAVWVSYIKAEAAPCAPVVCVPVPTLPSPQPSGQPGAFATPSPRPSVAPSPSTSPGVGQPPAPGAQIPGQDVGVTALAQASENGASGLSKQLKSQLDAPNTSGDWFLPIYSKTTTIGVWILLIALLLAVVQYLVSRRLGLVAASWLGWAPGSIGITAIAIAMTNVALAITDGLCAYVLSGLDLTGFLEHLAAALTLVAAGAGMLGALPFVGFMLAATLVVILIGLVAELLMRQIVIYICLAWLPLVASSSAWAPARGWLYRLAALQFAVIFAKFAVVVCLALGVAAFSSNPKMVGALGDSNLVAIVMGLIVLGLALLSPFALLRILPHSFEHGVQAVSGRARRTAMRTVRRGGANIQQRFGGSGAAGKFNIPLATKIGKAAKVAKVGAGTTVVPLSLVMSGGRIVASRGGKVAAAGDRPGGGKASGAAGKPSSRQPTPTNRVRPSSGTSGTSGAPPAGPTRPLKRPGPSTPGPRPPINNLPPPPPSTRKGP